MEASNHLSNFHNPSEAHWAQTKNRFYFPKRWTPCPPNAPRPRTSPLRHGSLSPHNTLKLPPVHSRPAVLARGALLTCELSTRTWTLRPALSQADLAIEL